MQRFVSEINWLGSYWLINCALGCLLGPPGLDALSCITVEKLHRHASAHGPAQATSKDTIFMLPSDHLVQPYPAEDCSVLSGDAECFGLPQRATALCWQLESKLRGISFHQIRAITNPATELVCHSTKWEPHPTQIPNQDIAPPNES